MSRQLWQTQLLMRRFVLQRWQIYLQDALKGGDWCPPSYCSNQRNELMAIVRTQGYKAHVNCTLISVLSSWVAHSSLWVAHSSSWVAHSSSLGYANLHPVHWTMSLLNCIFGQKNVHETPVNEAVGKEEKCRITSDQVLMQWLEGKYEDSMLSSMTEIHGHSHW